MAPEWSSHRAHQWRQRRNDEAMLKRKILKRLEKDFPEYFRKIHDEERDKLMDERKERENETI